MTVAITKILCSGDSRKHKPELPNILLVGGTFSNTPNPDGTYGAVSGLLTRFSRELDQLTLATITTVNGGNYEHLEYILNQTPEYDYVFWWANVDNQLPKIRNVKKIAPKTMLISSKRNDNQKYTFQELVERSLALKANLTFEFSKTDSGLFNIRLFDPLGSVWYDGTDIHNAVIACVKRMSFLKSMTRQSTIASPEDKNLIMKWYFDQFKSPEYQSEKTDIQIPNEQDFVNTVRKYAHKFQEFMPTVNTTRFVGNASLRPLPPQVGRCGKGMPSFRGTDDIIFVSKRNIDKQFIELENFVPVYVEDNKLMYCGPDKPSVDTPVQVKLYKALPNINYMLHSHCYIEDAPFTETAIPCGAIEEFDEVIKLIHNKYSDENQDQYIINLIGHGSIIMWNNMSQFHNKIEPTLKYCRRIMPEYMHPQI